MIIKSRSRKSNVDQLIRYIFVKDKIEPTHPVKIKPFRNVGIKLNFKDRDYLETESLDAKLLSEFKLFKGTLDEFIKSLVSDKSNTQIDSPIFKHNIRSGSIKGYIKEFESNEALRVRRRVDSVQAYHTIISFSNQDT